MHPGKRREKVRPPERPPIGAFDYSVIVLRAGDPVSLIERLNYWCDAETGQLSLAMQPGAVRPSHSLAIHCARSPEGFDILVAVLTPTAAVGGE